MSASSSTSFAGSVPAERLTHDTGLLDVSSLNCGPGATASGPALSEQNAKIVALMREGLKQVEIAARVGRSDRAVRQAVARMRCAGVDIPRRHAAEGPQRRTPVPFTAAEIAVLEDAVATGRLPGSVAKELGRNRDVIASKMLWIKTHRVERRTTTRRCIGWKNGIMGVRCDAEFKSAGAGHRLCEQCRSRA